MMLAYFVIGLIIAFFVGFALGQLRSSTWQVAAKRLVHLLPWVVLLTMLVTANEPRNTPPWAELAGAIVLTFALLWWNVMIWLGGVVSRQHA